MNNKIVFYVYFVLIACPNVLMADSICFYRGKGTGPVSSQRLLETLKKEVDATFYEVENPKEMSECIDKEEDKYRLKIIIPGGHAAVIAMALKSSFPKIKEAIKNGATYLGICAGAMIASNKVYLKNNVSFEDEEFIKSGQLLGLFNGNVRTLSHPNIPKQIIANENAKGRLVKIKDDQSNIFLVFWNQGGYFEGFSPESNEILSTYVEDEDQDENLKPYRDNSPATLVTRYGSGLVVLSQVHFEFGMLLNIPKEFSQNHALYAEMQLQNIKENKSYEQINNYETLCSEFLKRLLKIGKFNIK